MKKVFLELDQKLKQINGGKELSYEKNYARIEFNTDDDSPLNKPLKFRTLTIINNVFFKRVKNYIHKFI